MRLGSDEPGARERAQRVGVEVVGVRVRGGHDVDEAEPRRVDHPLGHAHVRLVGAGVLAGQRVRQVRVEQQVAAVVGDQEAALAEPPEVERSRGGLHVGEERLTGEQRTEHAGHDAADGHRVHRRAARPRGRAADRRGLGRRPGRQPAGTRGAGRRCRDPRDRRATARAAAAGRARRRRAAAARPRRATGPVFAVDANGTRSGATPVSAADQRWTAKGAIAAHGEGTLDPATGTRAIGLRTAAAILSHADGGLAAYAAALLNWHRRHRYCSACGRRATSSRAGSTRLCPNCGAEHHPRTDPVVIMLVTDGDRLLLGRQATWPSGRYSRAGGVRRAGRGARGGGRARGARGGRRRSSAGRATSRRSRGRSRPR